MTFLTFIWNWLLDRFGLGKLVIAGAIALGVIAFTVGVYAKGYASCASSYELAAERAKNKRLQQTIDEQNKAMAFGQRLADLMDKAEKTNDAIEEDVPGVVGDNDPCADADFVHRLAKLR